MTIEYYTKQVYGNELRYMVNPDHAFHWKLLTGKRTITKSEQKVLTEMTGVQFDQVLPPESIKRR